MKHRLTYHEDYQHDTDPIEVDAEEILSAEAHVTADGLRWIYVTRDTVKPAKR